MSFDSRPSDVSLSATSAAPKQSHWFIHRLRPKAVDSPPNLELTLPSNEKGLIYGKLIGQNFNKKDITVVVPNGTKPPKKMSLLTLNLHMDLGFKDISFCVQNKKKKNGLKSILRNVSGRFASGQLTAIMGPSGAGKTTLMNILTGYRTKNISGTIMVNGRERDLKAFRKYSCYIMQTDYLLPFLSVQEAMMDAAAFKLGDAVSLQNKKLLVGEILQTLSLSDCAQTRIANLSGGEKKRLSIAMELVNNPPIMFFDEPTSGLDSRNTFQCICLLKSLADEGRTIICTIHQPSARIFEKFDALYGLAEGQCIYKGSIPFLLPSLATVGLECPSYHNPADFLMEIASGEYGNLISRLVAAVDCEFIVDTALQGKSTPAIESQKLDLVLACKDESSNKHGGDHITEASKLNPQIFSSCEGHSSYPSSFFAQFAVLFKRTFLSIIRDMMLTQLRIGAHLVVGLFIGVLYFKIGNEASEVLSNTGYLFFSTLFLLFTAMMPTILTFPLEMNVFVKEHLNHWYSLKSYYFAKTMADLPFQIIFPIMYVVIAYFMTDQPYDVTRFLLFNFFCIMTSLVAQSIGLTIGAAMDVQQAVFFGPAMAIPALLFSGFFVKINTIPVYLRWLTYLSYIRYGFEGALISTYGLNRESLHCSEPFCVLKHPTKVLEELGINEDFLVWDAVLISVYFLVIRALGYFILRWKLKKQR